MDFRFQENVCSLCATFLKIMLKTCKKVDKSRPFGVE